MTQLEDIEQELSKIIKDLQHAHGLISDGQWGRALSRIEGCEEGLSILGESIASTFSWGQS